MPSLPLWLRQLVPWLALAGLVLAFAGTVLYVYLAVLNRRVALVLKLILAIVPLVALSIIFISNSIFTKTLAQVEEEVLFRLAALAQAAAGGRSTGTRWTGSGSRRITSATTTTPSRRRSIALVNSGADPWNQRVFANVAKLYNGMFYIMADYASSYGVLYPMPHAPFERYLAALATGELQRTSTRTRTAPTSRPLRPVRNAAGETVAVLYVGSSKDDLVLLQQAFRSEVTRDTAIAAGALSAVIAAVSVFLLLSIRQLQRAVGRMQGGAYETRVADPPARRDRRSRAGLQRHGRRRCRDLSADHDHARRVCPLRAPGVPAACSARGRSTRSSSATRSRWTWPCSSRTSARSPRCPRR